MHGLESPDTGATSSIVTPSSENDLRWNEMPLESQNLSIPAATAEKTYAVVCEEYGIQARKHTQYWTYLQDLDRMGLVKVAVQNDSGGRSGVVSLPDIPSKVLAAKLETVIEGTLGGGSS